jgi:MoaA/NifB/PqqE/SkfB family radical SAM enzyme
MVEERSSVFLHGGMSSEADMQREYYEKGLIYTVQIELTLKCSQGCSYCYASSDPNSPSGLPTEIIKELIDDASTINVRCIDWLGGDPLVRSDWYDIMQYSLKKNLINNIWTSGLPLKNKKIAKKAVEVTKNGGFISVHLDSLNPNIYKQVHKFCIEENISAILQGVDNVISLGKNPNEIWNCITLTKPVASTDVFDTMEWFWKNKGIRTVLTLFNPVSDSDSAEFEPSTELIQKAYKGRDEIMYQDDTSFSTMDVNKFYCGSMICVTNDGYYTPCSVIRTTEFGNLNTLRLKDIPKENPGDILMMRLRNPENLPAPCNDCEQNNVCFGCRSSAYYYSGDMFGCDPKCTKCQPNQ